MPDLSGLKISAGRSMLMPLQQCRKDNPVRIGEPAGAGVPCYLLRKQDLARWWRTRAACLSVLLALAATGAVLAEDIDPGRATGPEIQAYRENWVPQEYPSPARGWFYGDVVVVAGLLLSGVWLVRSHRPARWISVQLGCSLLYLGLIRGGCICPVGATANVLLGIAHPELVGLATMALFLVPLVVALASGRIFCSSVCPLGAVQHLLSRRRGLTLPRWLHHILLSLPVVLLLATAGEVWFGHGFLPCQIDPYKALFFQGHAFVQKLSALAMGSYAEPGWILVGGGLVWPLLAVALLVGWLIPRFFCRYACPYSVLLGLLASVGFWRREIDTNACVQCQRCVNQCPVQAIRCSADAKTVKISSYQCVQCGRCEDVCKKQAVCGNG